MVKIHKYTKAKSLKSDDAKLKGLKHESVPDSQLLVPNRHYENGRPDRKMFSSQTVYFFGKLKVQVSSRMNGSHRLCGQVTGIRISQHMATALQLPLCLVY